MGTIINTRRTFYHGGTVFGYRYRAAVVPRLHRIGAPFREPPQRHRHRGVTCTYVRTVCRIVQYAIIHPTGYRLPGEPLRLLPVPVLVVRVVDGVRVPRRAGGVPGHPGEGVEEAAGRVDGQRRVGAAAWRRRRRRTLRSRTL